MSTLSRKERVKKEKNMTLVCFDWDGTIADSWPVYKKAAIKYCDDNNLHLPDDEELRRSFGNTSWKGFSQWKENYEDQDRHRYLMYDLFYELLEVPENRLIIPGLDKVFDFCVRKDVSLAIATSRPRQPLEAALAYHGWSEIFQSILTGDCVDKLEYQHKPAPDTLRHLMNELNTEPSHTIMVGDTFMDVEMAKNAKCCSIAVTWGMGTEKELRSLSPDKLAHSTDDLLSALQDLSLEH
ncbi:MAG: HAD family hydrolase [Rhodospirillales bacterium]|nr:HAD family hydrolase [Rhodospirillales bacterium]